MDQNLFRWARAVRSRTRQTQPVLWLFTDAVRVPDPLAAVRRLARVRPRGLVGVVFRPEGYADPAALGRALAQLCRAAGMALTVAGDMNLAGYLGAGRHIRAGRRKLSAGAAASAVTTGSAHTRAELIRAERARIDIVFLSPVFATDSHVGGAWMGALRWSRQRHCIQIKVFALGGIDGRTVRYLPQTWGAGSITHLV